MTPLDVGACSRMLMIDALLTRVIDESLVKPEPSVLSLRRIIHGTFMNSTDLPFLYKQAIVLACDQAMLIVRSRTVFVDILKWIKTVRSLAIEKSADSMERNNENVAAACVENLPLKCENLAHLLAFLLIPVTDQLYRLSPAFAEYLTIHQTLVELLLYYPNRCSQNLHAFYGNRAAFSEMQAQVTTTWLECFQNCRAKYHRLHAAAGNGHAVHHRSNALNNARFSTTTSTEEEGSCSPVILLVDVTSDEHAEYVQTRQARQSSSRTSKLGRKKSVPLKKATTRTRKRSSKVNALSDADHSADACAQQDLLNSVEQQTQNLADRFVSAATTSRLNHQQHQEGADQMVIVENDGEFYLVSNQDLIAVVDKAAEPATTNTTDNNAPVPNLDECFTMSPAAPPERTSSDNIPAASSVLPRRRPKNTLSRRYSSFPIELLQEIEHVSGGGVGGNSCSNNIHHYSNSNSHSNTGGRGDAYAVKLQKLEARFSARSSAVPRQQQQPALAAVAASADDIVVASEVTKGDNASNTQQQREPSPPLYDFLSADFGVWNNNSDVSLRKINNNDADNYDDAEISPIKFRTVSGISDQISASFLDSSGCFGALTQQPPPPPPLPSSQQQQLSPAKQQQQSSATAAAAQLHNISCASSVFNISTSECDRLMDLSHRQLNELSLEQGIMLVGCSRDRAIAPQQQQLSSPNPLLNDSLVQSNDFMPSGQKNAPADLALSKQQQRETIVVKDGKLYKRIQPVAVPPNAK